MSGIRGLDVASIDSGPNSQFKFADIDSEKKNSDDIGSKTLKVKRRSSRQPARGTQVNQRLNIPRPFAKNAALAVDGLDPDKMLEELEVRQRAKELDLNLNQIDEVNDEMLTPTLQIRKKGLDESKVKIDGKLTKIKLARSSATVESNTGKLRLRLSNRLDQTSDIDKKSDVELNFK